MDKAKYCLLSEPVCLLVVVSRLPSHLFLDKDNCLSFI